MNTATTPSDSLDLWILKFDQRFLEARSVARVPCFCHRETAIVDDLPCPTSKKSATSCRCHGEAMKKKVPHFHFGLESNAPNWVVGLVPRVTAIPRAMSSSASHLKVGGASVLAMGTGTTGNAEIFIDILDQQNSTETSWCLKLQQTKKHGYVPTRLEVLKQWRSTMVAIHGCHTL